MKKKQNVQKALDAFKVSRGIDRQLYIDRGLISIWRGKAAIHTSRADKRKSRDKKKKEAIRDSED